MPSQSLSQLKEVQQRREALEEIAQLLLSYNQLSSSLEELVLSTTGETSVSDKAHELLDSLDGDQRQMSVDKIEMRLENLDLRIRDDLSYFIDLTTEKSLKTLNNDSEEELPKRVEQFKRKVKLSFSYRVLLCEHGEPVKPIELDVAPEIVKQTVASLRVKESSCQDRLIKELKSFQSLAKSVATHQDIPEAIRDELMFAEHQISENLVHLEAGNTIASIPSSFDSINLDFSIMALSEEFSAVGITQEEEAHQEGDSDLGRSATFLQKARQWLDSPVRGNSKKR